VRICGVKVREGVKRKMHGNSHRILLPAKIRDILGLPAAISAEELLHLVGDTDRPGVVTIINPDVAGEVTEDAKRKRA
jgi:hypothetical protein